MRLVQALIHMHFLLALAAGAQRWWMGQFGLSTDRQGIIGVSAAVIAAYGYLRLVRTSGPALLPPGQLRWVREHRRSMMVLVLLSGLLSIHLLQDHHLVFGPWSLLIPLLSMGYLTPNRKGRATGIREIPGSKAVIIALAWAFITCGVTDQEPPPGDAEMHCWLAMLQFSYFLSLAITYDIGDLHFDHADLRTAPQLFGVSGAKWLALLLLLPWCGLLLFSVLVAEHQVRWHFVLALLALGLTGLVITKAKPYRPRWYFTWLLDGLVAAPPLLAWVGIQLSNGRYF